MPLLHWLKLLFAVWGGPEAPEAHRVRIGVIDFFCVVLAVVFPWSTAVTVGLTLAILLMILITHGMGELRNNLSRPAFAFPLLLVALAAVGTTWTNDVPWNDRLRALDKILKLLWLLPLYVHFQQTRRATTIFVAFAASNFLVFLASLYVFISPDLGQLFGPKDPGILVKNYIDQSQAFAFAAVVLLAIAMELFRARQLARAITCVVVSIAFFADLVFINVARTAFVYVPAMLALLVLRYSRGWFSWVSFAGMFAVAVGLWMASPNLQMKVLKLSKEVSAFQTNSTTIDGNPASGAERLEFWRKSVEFIQSAPILGHGTGSVGALFSQAAIGQTGIMGKSIDNPHNQTLMMAIQWGLIGTLLLYCMWAAHVWLFRQGMDSQGDLVSWIGMVAVVQNILSSLLNSHLSDFYQGWLYVLAVSLAAGVQQQNRLCAGASVKLRPAKN